MIFARAAASSASLITPRSCRSSSSARRCSIDFSAAGGPASWLRFSLASNCSLAISGFSPPDRSTKNFQIEVAIPMTATIAANTRNAMNQLGIPLPSGLIDASAPLDLPCKAYALCQAKGHIPHVIRTRPPFAHNQALSVRASLAEWGMCRLAHSRQGASRWHQGNSQPITLRGSVACPAVGSWPDWRGGKHPRRAWPLERRPLDGGHQPQPEGPVGRKRDLGTSAWAMGTYGPATGTSHTQFLRWNSTRGPQS